MGRLLPLSYTRPNHVNQQTLTGGDNSLDRAENSDGSLRSGTSGSSASIPDSLAFDRIVDGGTCPPMTTRDFMNYLVYIEHAAENLQFYLWFKNYEERFHTATTSDMALSPEWTQAMEDEAVARIGKEHAEKLRRQTSATQMFKGTDFENHKHEFAPLDCANPFGTSPRTSDSKGEEDLTYAVSKSASSAATSNYQSHASDAFRAAGARQPFTIQPFRDEINRVIATYIMDGALRQLNLSAAQQKTAVQALSYTTHPSALRIVMVAVESTLRRQAHPNFVRWSICNGNPARVLFARALGGGLVVAGFVIALVLTLSKAGRGYRALAAIAFVLGISTLVAAYKGMCVVLHGMHHRHVRPWELFVDSEDASSSGKISFESFGSSNSYEDEPWVVKYDRRNVVRKVFDREVWIQEPALRQIQDTIFVQAMLAALLLGGVLTAVFVAVPGGGFF